MSAQIGATSPGFDQVHMLCYLADIRGKKVNITFSLRIGLFTSVCITISLFSFVLWKRETLDFGIKKITKVQAVASRVLEALKDIRVA